MSRFGSRSLRSVFHTVSLLCLAALLPWAKAAQATDVDLMLVYDTTATTWVAGHGGMTAFSQDVVNRMNQAMQNSGVSVTFKLVHSMSVNYTTQSSRTTPMTADLNALQSGQGEFAQVASARNTYGADLVAMLVDHGYDYGYVGQGFTLTSWSGHPDYAHTVNAIRAVETTHTLTHEVGHNLGAHHSKYQASSPGPNSYLDGQYSAGWYFLGTDGNAYHTIMAYDSDGYGNYYDEVPLFSTPLKTYQGVPAGSASEGDNARLLSETKDTIAAYRSSAVVGVDYSKQVYVMFAGYFGRPPAPAGYDYYSNWMTLSQGNYLIIVDDFFRSAESQGLYSALTTEDKIALVYNYLFARSPAASGLAYWKALIDGQQISVAEMAYTIAYNAAAADQAVLNAKLSASAAFMTTLQQYNQTAACAMNPEFGRAFLSGITSQSAADAAIASMQSTVNSMCGG